MIMSRKYIKSPVRIHKYVPYEDDFIQVESKRKKEKLTLWDILGGFLKDINNLMISSSFAGFIIPAALIVFGIVIIFNQVWPQVEQYVKYSSGYYDTASVALVAGDYVARTEYISDPGAEYFKTLSSVANQNNTPLVDTISNQYSGRFSLSISSVGLNNIPVTANVNSGVEAEYQDKLRWGLAHFSGTGLPISDVENNIVIYGHSASGNYYERTKDIVAAFSMLNQVKVGDIVGIEMEGQSFQYRIIKSKIVEPSDVSILIGKQNERTLTLFTCFPNGNRAKRFVAIAKPI